MQQQCRFITSKGRCEQPAELHVVPGTKRLERIEGGRLIGTAKSVPNQDRLCYYHQKLKDGLLCDHEGRPYNKWDE